MWDTCCKAPTRRVADSRCCRWYDRPRAIFWERQFRSEGFPRFSGINLFTPGSGACFTPFLYEYIYIFHFIIIENILFFSKKLFKQNVYIHSSAQYAARGNSHIEPTRVPLFIAPRTSSGIGTRYRVWFFSTHRFFSLTWPLTNTNILLQMTDITHNRT